MARRKDTEVDIMAIQDVALRLTGLVDYDLLIAFIMRKTGATYQEISDTLILGSRQLAEYYVKQAEDKLR